MYNFIEEMEKNENDSENNSDGDSENVIDNNEKRYTYLMDRHADKNIVNHDILTHNMNIYGRGLLNVLCYHVTQNSKYPFIQFMLEKVPFCNDIIKEKLVLPLLTVSQETDQDFSITMIEKIKNSLSAIGCDPSMLTLDAYKGLISDKNERVYALVDISIVDIFRISLTRNNPIWFSLPTEIMNIRSICNIPIDDDVTELFLNMPELSVLNIPDKMDTYPIPDAVYSGSYFRNVEFQSVFGVSKKQVYKSCGEYYYYFRLFEDAVKDGGWVNEGGHKMIDLNDVSITHNPAGTKLVDNEYGRYIRGGINRYALFPENYMVYTEPTKTLSLTDDDINIKFGVHKCIIIQYEEEDIDTILPDILIKEYESAYPISYHMLAKGILGDKYEIDQQDKYMII
jgi:hypothetical protein